MNDDYDRGARGADRLGQMLVEVLTMISTQRHAEMRAEGKMHPLSPHEARDHAVQACSMVLGVVVLSLCEATGQDFAAIMDRAAQHIGVAANAVPLMEP